MENHTELPSSPQKRRRRPSVRLGEIGLPAPYDSAALLLEPPKRRKQVAVDASSSAEMLSAGKGCGAKPPRIRPLDHVAADKKLVEEGWSVIEPAVALSDEQKLATCANVAATSITEQQVKPRSGVVRKVNNKLRSRAFHGGRVNAVSHVAGKSKMTENQGAARPNSGADVRDSFKGEEQGDRALQVDDDAPSLAKASSDSQELFGSGSKGKDELPAEDSRDVFNSGEDGVTNPNGPGDELQGAIEDGPGQANGKSGSGVLKLDDGDGILGRQAESRAVAGEPSRRLQAVAANGTTVTPTFSERVTMASGVRGWLHALGLGKYSDMFEVNEVDTEVLPLLTMEDLREMGVGAVGARRKMLTAIEELGQLCGI